MEDNRLFETALGLQEPWTVTEVELRPLEREVWVRVGTQAGATLRCPDCNESAPGYDRTEERRWRHLDTMQYRTIVISRVPRVQCPTHGVRQVRVAWAEDRSRFTSLFEALAIRFLKEMSLSGMAELMQLSWDEAAGIFRRAVARGLARRKQELIRFYGRGRDQLSEAS